MREKRLILAFSVLGALGLALLPLGGFSGEWHSGTNNVCYDCHTMHFSQTHNWDGSAPVSMVAQQNGNWLGASGPNQFLLKAPANQLCLACHDGQTFAPDVLGANSNASPSQGRQAGALNTAALGAPYDQWKGHTLDSTATPPGWNPAAVAAPPTWYNAAGGLECISCHAQHGPTTAYRNLGPYSLGASAANFRPTYEINPYNYGFDLSKDVWIHVSGYAPNTGSAATFNPFYDSANILFYRNDVTVGITKTSNRMDTFCGGCHGDFHGGPADTNIGATAAALDGFLRHPTSQVTIGDSAAQGYGGHSSLSRFQANTTKVKVYSSTYVTGGFSPTYADATPGCVSCHKAHGNQNPFGLIFLNGNAASVGEEGGYAAGQTTDLAQGYRNLCGQCHVQGN